MSRIKEFPLLSPDEAVAAIPHGATVSFSGFTPAGAAKVVPRALAARARNEHAAGRAFKIRVLTGASSGQVIDEELARAKAVAWRAPYQTGSEMRRQINREQVEYVDMHLSHLPQTVLFGFFGRIDLAVVEATEVTRDGRVFLTTSIGASPTYLQYADRVVIEINRRHSPRLCEMADILLLPAPPHRLPIPIYEPLGRAGLPYAKVDPRKIIGIVDNDAPDEVAAFSCAGTNGRRIADHLVAFFRAEMRAGRIPQAFLPLQAGVGNLTNTVMAALGADPDIPPFGMYSEVLQDSIIDLIVAGRLLGASATALAITAPKMAEVVSSLDFFAQRIVLRPQEISNHPGVIRRLGVIALNTALEADIYGNANSSHLFGTDIVNGIGGSGEFTRNSYLSIFMTASTAKEGRISSIVPMVSHVDSNEHSVQVLVTEQGLADLRGLGPMQRARAIIANCAHPDYRDYLNDYLQNARPGHIRHDLGRCFELHRNLLATGRMLAGVGAPESVN